jgi:hypothetical protein
MDCQDTCGRDDEPLNTVVRDDADATQLFNRHVLHCCHCAAGRGNCGVDAATERIFVQDDRLRTSHDDGRVCELIPVEMRLGLAAGVDSATGDGATADPDLRLLGADDGCPETLVDGTPDDDGLRVGRDVGGVIVEVVGINEMPELSTA